MADKKQIVVAPGDGIGPEIMDGTLRILSAAEVPLSWESVELGQALYGSGNSSGIADETWPILRKAGVLLKGPIMTPQGKGFKSVNVTIRKTLGLYANVRPCKAYAPHIASAYPDMDLVIVRENEEDLYAGIEHRQTPEVFQVLKLITRPGSERIVRYAFEYARACGRKKVTCMSKDNIMKLTDGLFHQVFEEVAAEYPEIESDHFIIDIGSAKLATAPERFDVIVTANLYGDILSDIAAEIAGSIGIASSANIGDTFAMFEAVHGSAPDIAGKGIANPSGLLLAAVQMLVHLGMSESAQKIKNAWLKTIEDGVHTADIFSETTSKKRVSCQEFSDAVIERLGQTPESLQPEAFQARSFNVAHQPVCTKKELVGIDAFICWDEDSRNPVALAEKLKKAESSDLTLRLITNRGVKVYPGGQPETFCTDHWRCRFRTEEVSLPYQELITLLQRISDQGLEVIKTENLYTFDGELGFSLGQGE